MDGRITGYWSDHGIGKWIISCGDALDVFALEQDLEPDSQGRGLAVSFDLSAEGCRGGMFRAINVKCSQDQP
jgi:hypothetical protein